MEQRARGSNPVLSVATTPALPPTSTDRPTHHISTMYSAMLTLLLSSALAAAAASASATVSTAAPDPFADPSQTYNFLALADWGEDNAGQYVIRCSSVARARPSCAEPCRRGFLGWAAPCPAPKPPFDRASPEFSMVVLNAKPKGCKKRSLRARRARGHTPARGAGLGGVRTTTLPRHGHATAKGQGPCLSGPGVLLRQ